MTVDKITLQGVMVMGIGLRGGEGRGLGLVFNKGGGVIYLGFVLLKGDIVLDLGFRGVGWGFGFSFPYGLVCCA